MKTKALILEIIADNPGIESKEIQNKLKKENNRNVTYVHVLSYLTRFIYSGQVIVQEDSFCNYHYHSSNYFSRPAWSNLGVIR